jgi:hypothetical protein
VSFSTCARRLRWVRWRDRGIGSEFCISFLPFPFLLFHLISFRCEGRREDGDGDGGIGSGVIIFLPDKKESMGREVTRGKVHKEAAN